MSRPLSKRLGIGLLLLMVALFFGLTVRPIGHIAWSWWTDVDTREPVPAGVLDDASGREAVTPLEIVVVPRDTAEAVGTVRDALDRARASGLGISVGGTRRTQGGHTLIDGGIYLDMTAHDRVEVDAEAHIATVGAGATWGDVLAALDPHGLSVAVMQTDRDFTVGGSISVNAHGSTHGRPPIVDTVRGLDVVTATGDLTHCTPSGADGLCPLVVGGYGLFGVILDIDLEVVDNVPLLAAREVVPVADLDTTWTRLTADPGTELAHGQLSVEPSTYLDQAIITVHRRQPGIPAPLSERQGAPFLRALLRGSAGNAYGRGLRWRLERSLGGEMIMEISRNTLLNWPSSVLDERRGGFTDTIVEVAVPVERIAQLCDRLRGVFPDAADLIDVNVARVEPDATTALPWARAASYVVTLTVNHPTSDETGVAAATRAVIDHALDLGGTYNLAHRPHATPRQRLRAYPSLGDVIARKRELDPDGVFQSGFWGHISR